MTDVALEWAGKNVNNNPHISDLIEIRKASNAQKTSKEDVDNQLLSDENKPSSGGSTKEEAESVASKLEVVASELKKDESGQPVLLGVVKNGEHFDFCMCNPPFFETMEEAGLNPRTACGGTPEEMVCPGGEMAFITRIIDDSVALKQSFR